MGRRTALLAGDKVQLVRIERGKAIQFITNHRGQIARRRRRQPQGLHQHRLRSQQQHLAHLPHHWRHGGGQWPVVEPVGDIVQRQPARQAATQFLEPQSPALLQQAATPALGDRRRKRLQARREEVIHSCQRSTR